MPPLPYDILVSQAQMLSTSTIMLYYIYPSMPDHMSFLDIQKMKSNVIDNPTWDYRARIQIRDHFLFMHMHTLS